jgi:arylsulfatase
MAEKKFRGVIDVDIRDSVPDWSPFEAPKAPRRAPNVVYVVLDDVGFSAMSSYGGPIETPNIDRIARDGVRYTQWHTTALCSPTRSCLLTGRNHTRNSMACITEAAIGFPNGSGVIPRENGMVSQILAAGGWNTYIVGKWHLCPESEMNLAATRRNWPNGRGFERFYGFLGAETNQWYPDLVYDNHPVDQPKSPAEGYHLTEDITDRALEFIKDAKTIAPGKPFFLYYAPGACHAPHHAPREWIDRFKGRFDTGYEAIRERTLARQKELRIVPPDTQVPPINPIGTPENRTGPNGQPFPALDYTRPWDSLAADEQRLFARMAEVYAGFLAHTDHQIGRLLDYLEETEQRDDTLVILVSDNGASGEGGPNGSVNENKMANGIPDDIRENLAMIDELGGPKTYNHYPNGWAMAFNTPFKMWKRYEFNGGTSDPCIISWPRGLRARGELRHQYHHAIDLVPTILDVLGVEAPETIDGHVQSKFDGVSMRYSFEDGAAPTTRRTQFYSMLGSRGIWHDGWKAVTTRTRGSCFTRRSTDPRCTTSRTRSRTGCERSSTSGTRRLAPTRRSRSTTGPRSRSSRRPARYSASRGRATSTIPTSPSCLSPRLSTSATAPTRSGPSWTSPRRARRASSSLTAPGSAAMRSTSRTTGCTTSTTSSAASSRRSWRPRTCLPERT